MPENKHILGKAKKIHLLTKISRIASQINE